MTVFMRSAVTISLVPQAKGGPFVFWEGLEHGCAQAATLGFDAVEIFPPAAELLQNSGLVGLLARNRLRVAAVGTGGGWVVRKLTLTSADRAVRTEARSFIRGVIDAAGALGAPAIIGSMQGRWDAD